MDLKHPKYTREENLACKLTDKQIAEIQTRHKKGEFYSVIAKDYNITPQAIFYWCLDEKTRKERVAARKRVAHNDPEWFKKYRERKLSLHPELRAYENQFTYEYKLKNRPRQKEITKAINHRSWIKHKKKLTLKQLEWQRTHREYLHNYSNEYRKKNLERVRAYARKSYRKLHPIIQRVRKG